MSPTNGKHGVLRLAKAALEAHSDEFIRLTQEVAHLLEKESGQVGKMHVKGKLATLPSEGEAIIIGDIHGDLESLVHVLRDSNFIDQAQRQKDIVLIFLGDYGDRGIYSVEVYYIVLCLKQRFQEKVILMRGNHEGPDDLPVYPHDLPMQFQQRFGGNGDPAYASVRRLFNLLYNVVLVENRYILIHGGFPTEACSLDDLAFAHVKHPKETFLEEMLWNDPEENIEGAYPSPRGAGKLFGSDVTKTFLDKFQTNALIRGHEPSVEGFKLNHDKRVLTLFSRKGEPYFNEHGAYLVVDLSLRIQNAGELLPWIRKF
jgi:diadenosine tetraphosphatase ApaH/serine/threonine PP2A family protein phosphatase